MILWDWNKLCKLFTFISENYFFLNNQKSDSFYISAETNVGCQTITCHLSSVTLTCRLTHIKLSAETGGDKMMGEKSVHIEWMSNESMHTLERKHKNSESTIKKWRDTDWKRKDGNKPASFFHSNEDRLIQSHVLLLRSLINWRCVEAKLWVWQQFLSLSSLWLFLLRLIFH